MGVFAVLALLAALPVAWSVLARRESRACSAGRCCGGRTGGRGRRRQGIRERLARHGGYHPGPARPWCRGVAAFSWASNVVRLLVLAHPAALAAFPAASSPG